MNERSFLINDPADNRQYYGGNQSWFYRNTQARAGCGHVAAVNTYLQLTKQFPINKADYMQYMNEMYRTMGAFEVPILRKFYDLGGKDMKLFKVIPPSFGQGTPGYILGLLRFGKRHNMKLRPYLRMTFFCSYRSGLRFIKKGLKDSGAVTLLTSLNRHPLTLYKDFLSTSSPSYNVKGGMKNHFVTITDVDESGGSPKLVISTWGRIATIDYATLVRSWKRPGALQSAMFYFQPIR